MDAFASYRLAKPALGRRKTSLLPLEQKAVFGPKARMSLNARRIRFASGAPRFSRTKPDYYRLVRTIRTLANFGRGKKMR
jgi:hypothetical protein